MTASRSWGYMERLGVGIAKRESVNGVQGKLARVSDSILNWPLNVDPAQPDFAVPYPASIEQPPATGISSSR